MGVAVALIRVSAGLEGHGRQGRAGNVEHALVTIP